MASASVEIGGINLNGKGGSSINGPCVYQETLAISGTTATMTNAVTAAQVAAGNNVGRIATDTDCYFAIGSTPDPTATTATAATTARRFLSAGGSIEQLMTIGDKAAVHT